MREVFLKDISKISAGNSAPKKDEFSKEGTPFVRAGSLTFLTKYESLDKCEKVTEAVAIKKKLKLFKKDSILFAKSGMSSKMGRIYQLEYDAFVVSHLAIIEVDKSEANPSYIKYFFILKPPFYLIRDDAYPSIKLEDIKNITLNLPDLPTQIKIVALLDKASALVQKREKSIAVLDELLRAQFLEMFGGPVLNPKGWEMMPISDFSNSRLGKMLDKKKMKGNNLKDYLGNTNVKWFRFDFSNLKQMDFNEKDTLTFKIIEGDILMCEGGDIGRCAIWKNEMEDCYFQKALHRISLDKEIMLSNIFVYNFYLLSNNGGLQKYMGGATISHLTGVELKKLKLPIPPIELQNQFETIYHNIQAQKETLTQSKTELENLYNSLLQRAFKGELDFDIQEYDEKTEAVKMKLV